MLPLSEKLSEKPGYPRRSPEGDPAHVWNWARNAVLGASSSVCAPTTEEELRAVVASGGGSVRVVGSRMSPGRLLELRATGDTLLDLRHLRGLLAVDADSATFAGGTPLAEVYAALAELGRELPSSPGVIAEQTVGGALATGTHGQGLAQSTLADAALSIRLVLADGSVLDVDEAHPWSGAVRLGLGSLGVLARVRLRTRPSRLWTCAKDAVDDASLEADVVRWSTEHALSKAWWFPDEGRVHVWTAREASESEASAHRAGGGRLVEHGLPSSAMNDVVDATLATMREDTRIADAGGKPYRTVARFRDFADVTGDVYQVFCRGIATPQINVEIGVPLARAGEVVAAVRAWHRESRPHLHYPVILRATGPSSSWLSPSAGADTCFFGFVVYYAEDGSLSAEGVEFLRAVERLLAAHGGRPHWGKYFDESLYDWPALYPRWEDFRRVRDVLDPHHRFANAFTARLFA